MPRRNSHGEVGEPSLTIIPARISRQGGLPSRHPPPRKSVLRRWQNAVRSRPVGKPRNTTPNEQSCYPQRVRPDQKAVVGRSGNISLHTNSFFWNQINYYYYYYYYYKKHYLYIFKKIYILHFYSKIYKNSNNS